MALLEEIERAKPDVFAGIKRRIWEKVRCVVGGG